MFKTRRHWKLWRLWKFRICLNKEILETLETLEILHMFINRSHWKLGNLETWKLGNFILLVMKEQSKDLQFLFKQELLNNIKEKITPNTIKKKNTNNRKLDDAILNQIRINRKKNQERYYSQENQEYVNKDHCAIGRVIDEQEGLKRVIDEQESLKRVIDEQESLKRVIDEQESLKRVIDEQEGLKRVIDEQENFKRVIEHRENKENLLKCVNEKRGESIIKNGQIINKGKFTYSTEY
jgi:hypothetical protein